MSVSTLTNQSTTCLRRRTAKSVASPQRGRLLRRYVSIFYTAKVKNDIICPNFSYI